MCSKLYGTLVSFRFSYSSHLEIECFCSSTPMRTDMDSRYATSCIDDNRCSESLGDNINDTEKKRSGIVLSNGARQPQRRLRGLKPDWRCLNVGRGNKLDAVQEILGKTQYESAQNLNRVYNFYEARCLA